QKKVDWYFNAGPDPWSKPIVPQWKPYSPADCEKIEQAFQNKQDTVDIGNYTIRLGTNPVQISKVDEKKQRQVARGDPIVNGGS
ncbi:unnamed protein product, partial [Didymodactylos carnosus]